MTTNPLPAPLEASMLPWMPFQEDQAKAFRNNDGWDAYVGYLHFTIDVYSVPPTGFIIVLRLQNILTNQELEYVEFKDLTQAVQKAETLFEGVYSNLCSSIQKQLHDSF